jgi:hypothetical protein
MDPPTRARTEGLHLLDLLALMVGYGLASLLVRAFWPSDDSPDAGHVVAIGITYAWLGLAMSGPVVLAIHRRAAARAPEAVADADAGASPSRTWAELAWLIIGFYWIGLTILVVPIRLAQAPLRDATVLGVFPILAALVLRFIGPVPRAAQPGWTHRTAIGLLLTWPVAWVALILLGKTLL